MVPLLKAAKKLCKNGSKVPGENYTAFTTAEMPPPHGFFATKRGPDSDKESSHVVGKCRGAG